MTRPKSDRFGKPVDLIDDDLADALRGDIPEVERDRLPLVVFGGVVLAVVIGIALIWGWA